MTINRANQVWALDTSYIPVAWGFAYLIAVVDWASRKVTLKVLVRQDGDGRVWLSYNTPIDYRAQAVEQYVELSTQSVGFDVVVASVGGPTLDASFAAVKHLVMWSARWVGVRIRWLRCRFAKRRTQACSPFMRRLPCAA